jgi:NAD(P)-dependent dehydrogenase (short-subunit alcohol dehydrogenase family)
MEFKGKRILVTGSTSGIGRATAELFHAAGATVAINGRSVQGVAKTIREIGVDRLIEAPGDVGSVAGCEAMIGAALTALGGLDCLVNNVAINSPGGTLEVTEAQWDELMAVNLRSALFCTKAALPALRASRGNIVMVASAAGLMAGPSENLLYAISKAGLIGLARTLALEVAPHHVRVNCVCPGYTDTPLSQQSFERLGDVVPKVTPLARPGSAREIASAIVYLASDDAGYCTGTNLVNDGGCYAGASWGTRA